MKILLVNDYSEPDGGTEVYFSQLKKALKELGHQVYSFSISQTFSQEGDDYVYHVTPNSAIRYITGLTIHPGIMYKLIKFVEEIDPDIVHLHDIDRFPATLLLPFIKKRVKVIRSIHDYGFFCPTCWAVRQDDLQICSKIAKDCNKHCMPTYKYCIYRYLFAVKHYLYNKVIDEYVAGSKYLEFCLSRKVKQPVHYIPYFIEKQKIKFSKRDKNSILYVGALSKQKGLKFLIAAIYFIFRKNKDATLTIIGRGEYKKMLEAFIDVLDIKDKVFFKGTLSHDKLMEEYPKHSVLVVPSIWMEQFGLVGIESTICETPIVASKIGGIPDWLTEGHNGYFVERGSLQDIIDQVLKVWNDKNMPKKIKKHKLLIIKKFSKEQHIKSLLRLYGTI